MMYPPSINVTGRDIIGCVDIDWVQLELDIGRFDPSRFAAAFERVAVSGVALTTLEEIGNTAVNQRRMYELNAECSADIPGRGPFYSWPEYLQARIEVPSFDPRGVVLALYDGSWIGMAATSNHADEGYVFNEMTGVVRSHRRKLLALAMKVHGLGFARDLGIDHARTIHQPDNHGMIALNRQLGYVDAAWDS